jgi:Mn2+/Fe2+ NRAMP family transporter
MRLVQHPCLLFCCCPQGLNLLQSIQLPFALIPVLAFTGSSVLMGSLATKGFRLAAAWAVALCVICVNMTAVAQVASTWVSVT